MQANPTKPKQHAQHAGPQGVCNMLTDCAVLDTTQASEAAAAAAQKKAAEFEGVSIEVGGGAASLL